MRSRVVVAAIALSLAVTAPLDAARPAKALDLHEIHWGEATIPGSVCGASRPIRLHRRLAIVESRRFRGYRRVHVDSAWSGVTYGDLDRDGKDEAAFQVDCNNGGGTADGVLAFAAVVFSGTGGRLRVVGVITPKQHYRIGTRYPPIVGVVRILAGRVISPEAWYGPRDSVCCASGRAKTIWIYKRAMLRPLRTIVLHRPRR